MLLLIPIGHTQTISKIPWVTAGIVATCVLIQVASAFTSTTRAEYLAIAEPLAQAKVAQQVAQANKPAPEGDEAKAKLDALQTKIDGLQTELDALETRDVALRLAYRNGTGVNLKMLTSAFAHGGWLHLIGNMLFLYLCGCNLEDRWGKRAFAAFYVAAALVSSAFPAFLHRHEHGLSLGASGAIAACMGAFLIYYAKAEVRFFYFWFNFMRPKMGTFEAAAYWAGGLWFALQLIDFAFEASGYSDGVGYSAHVSGFVFGAATAFALKQLGYDRLLQKSVEPEGNWEEDEEVTRALSLVHDGASADALAAFKALRKQKPRNGTVLHELHDLGMRERDAEALNATTSDFLLEMLRRGEGPEAIARLQSIEALFPDVALGDRALALLAKCSFELTNNELAVRLSNRLLKDFPQSPLLPSALVEVAKAQLRAGKTEAAHKTLQQVLTRFPHDPFAREAKRLLETPEVGAA